MGVGRAQDVLGCINDGLRLQELSMLRRHRPPLPFYAARAMGAGAVDGHGRPVVEGKGAVMVWYPWAIILVVAIYLVLAEVDR